MASVSTDLPDDAERAAIRRLTAEIERDDGAPPLSDQALSQLGSTDVTHLIAHHDDTVVGYAQRAGDAAEIAARSDVVSLLIDRLAEPGLRVWAHGRQSRLAGPLREH